MPENNTNERIAKLELHHQYLSDELKELKDTYKEDMAEIKTCLLAIQEQTSSWKHIFWGITIALTAVFTVIQYIFGLFNFDIKTFFTTGHS